MVAVVAEACAAAMAAGSAHGMADLQWPALRPLVLPLPATSHDGGAGPLPSLVVALRDQAAVVPLARVVGQGGGPLAQPPSLRERWARGPALLLLVTRYRALPLPSLPPDHPFPFSDWI